MGGPAEFGPHVGYLQLLQTSPSRVPLRPAKHVISKVLNKTLLCVLAAALAMAGTAICTTVQTAAASSPTTKLDLAMTASYACPFSCAAKWQLDIDQWYCLFWSGDLQAVRHRSGHGYHEGG